MVASMISSSDLAIQLMLPPASGEHGANTISISNVETLTGLAGDDSIVLSTAITAGLVDLGAGNDRLALGNFTILRAFATGGKAAIIAPLAGLYPVVSIPIAIAYFGERPGAMQAWGIVLALVAVVLLAIESEPATLVRRASEPVER
jgi:hypothetical protein